MHSSARSGTVPHHTGLIALRCSTATNDEKVEVRLLDRATGIAPGQAVVVYDGTRVVGSATIASAVA